MNGFWAALAFLSRLPTPRTATEPRRGLPFFPLVGLLFGALAVGLYLLLSLHRPGTILPGTAAIVLVYALSGGLHADGLMDLADSILAVEPERREEIRRDPRTGAMGVMAFVMAFSLKLAALLSLPVDLRTAALLLFPLLGRWAILPALIVTRRGGPNSLTRLFLPLPPLWLVFPALLSAGIALFLFGGRGVMVWLLVTLLGLTAGLYGGRQPEGLNGDILGSLEEVAEILALTLL